MSERKVLNKYYPPDFDPTKIPKLRLPKNRNFGIRLMAPFNMRCNTCGEYIYKGKKFNSQKETVDDKNYLGLHIFRFYIKCPKCIAVIAFRTDPETTDYVLEAGATRNFEALRTAEQLAIKEQKEKEEELKNDPMKVLENRSLKSQQEIEMIENLEELRQIRKHQNDVDLQELLKQKAKSAKELAEELARKQEEEDENFVKAQFNRTKRLAETIVEDIPAPKNIKTENITRLSSNSSRSQEAILGTIIKKRKRESENAVNDSGNAALPETENVDEVSSAAQQDTSATAQVKPPPKTALSNLVGYGNDSDSNEDSD